MKKYGFSFSAKRALGISALKGKASRNLGIPLTRAGRQRKAGKAVGCCVFFLALLSSLTICFAEWGPTIRVVNGKKYNFEKIIEFAKNAPHIKVNQLTESERASLDEKQRRYGPYIFRAVVVSQVTAQGLLVYYCDYRGQSMGGNPLLIKNYPGASNLADGDVLREFIAMPVGNFKYTTVIGAASTVRAFDYGIPSADQPIPLQWSPN